MMRSFRRFIQHYFAFSSRETNAFMLLVPMMGLVMLTPYFYRSYLMDQTSSAHDSKSSLLVLEEIQSTMEKERAQPAPVTEQRLTPFRFDPNTISRSQLEEMGLSTRVATNLVNYRLKGGSFRVKNDLSRIYGLSDRDFNTLFPYIDLPEVQPAPKIIAENVEPSTEPSSPVIYDLNLASPEDLMETRGIGEKLSQRIVAFRNGLGGYHSMAQLKEVYGLKEEVISRLEERYVVSDSFQIRPLNLATAPREELARHPYISYKLARLLVAYRDQHRLDSLQQLLGMKVMTDSLFRKISPYLTLSAPE